MAVAAGVFAGLLVLRWALVRFTERGPQPGAATTLRQLVAALERRTHVVVLLLAALFAGSRLLTLPDDADADIRATTIIALLAQGGLWGSATIAFGARWYQEHDPDATVASALDAGRYAARWCSGRCC